MVSALSYLCGMAASVFVAVSLTIAAVRWFHLCRPYDRKPKYYYPGRPFVIAIFLNALVLLPYALHPDSPDAWFLARVYFLPVTIFHFTILLFSYFGNVMQWKKWRLPTLIFGFPVVFSMLAALGMAVWPGGQVEQMAPALTWTLLYVMGVITTGICIAAMLVVLAWARRFDADDFSNPADFPVTTARRWTLLVLVNLILCWTGALAASPGLMAVIMLLLAASSVLFIITALHPHRSQPVEEPEEEAAAPVGEPEDETAAPVEATAPKRAASGRKRAEILSAIRFVVEEQKAYLDAHLTIQDVADRCGYSRSTLSGLFKAELGGFFNYVNRLRVQHVESYLQEHPSATLQEAVLESGFNSRQAYYAVKAKV